MGGTALRAARPPRRVAVRLSLPPACCGLRHRQGHLPGSPGSPGSSWGGPPITYPRFKNERDRKIQDHRKTQETLQTQGMYLRTAFLFAGSRQGQPARGGQSMRSPRASVGARVVQGLVTGTSAAISRGSVYQEALILSSPGNWPQAVQQQIDQLLADQGGGHRGGRCRGGGRRPPRTSRGQPRGGTQDAKGPRAEAQGPGAEAQRPVPESVDPEPPTRPRRRRRCGPHLRAPTKPVGMRLLPQALHLPDGPKPHLQEEQRLGTFAPGGRRHPSGVTPPRFCF